MSAAHSRTSASCHSINLINKYNTRCIFLGVFKQIPHTGSSYADKHLHEIRAGNRKERHSCLTCNSFCKQCFTGSRRSYKKYSFRNSGANLYIFLRRLQEIHNFLQLFFLFLQSCNPCKCNLFIFLRTQTRTALSKIHCFGVRSASLPVHKEKQQKDTAHGKKRRHNCCQKPIVSRHIRHRICDVVFLQIFLNLIYIGNIQISGVTTYTRFFLQTYFHPSGRNRFILAYRHLLYVICLHQLFKCLPGNLILSLLKQVRKPEYHK